MANSQPTLSETELHQLKWLCGTCLALLGLWALALINFSGVLLVPILVAVMLLILWLPSLPGWLPKWSWNLATPLLVLLIAVDFINSRGAILDPVLRMTLALMFFRALEYRKRREDLQLILLVLFCLIISGVMTQGLTFAVQFFLFAPLAMGTLFLLNLLEASHARTLTRADWKGFRWRLFLRRVGQNLNLKMLGLGSVLFIVLAGLSALIFMLIPRLEFQQTLSFMNRASVGVIGISDSLSLGDVSQLNDDDSPALRVEPPTATALPETAYWRMIVLDRYAGGEFHSSRIEPQMQVSYGVGTFMAGTEHYVPDAPMWQFILEPSVSEYLPLPGTFADLSLSQRLRYKNDTERHMVQLSRIPIDRLGYRMHSVSLSPRLEASLREREALNRPKPIPQVISTNGLPENLGYPLTTLEVPEAHSEAYQKLSQITHEITQGRALNTQGLATEATKWLQQNFTYSLEDLTDYSSSQHPLIHWMSEADRGWCEHFAGSIALIARMHGIPSRVVVGFSGGEWNTYESYLLVRNRNAHAWVELYDGSHWVRVDPTPAGGLGTGSGSAEGFGASIQRFSGLQAFLDGLRMSWYQQVINFDQDDQVALAEQATQTAKSSFEQLREQLSHWLTAAKAWLTEKWSPDKALKALVLVLLTVTTMVLIRGCWVLLRRSLFRKSDWWRTHVALGRIRKSASKGLLRTQRSQERFQPLDYQYLVAQYQRLRYGDLAEFPDPDQALKQLRTLRRRYSQKR
jgi:transglutaminase-like putative cysteine protease